MEVGGVDRVCDQCGESFEVTQQQRSRLTQKGLRSGSCLTAVTVVLQ